MHSFLCSAILLAVASVSVAYDGNLMLEIVNKERNGRGIKPLTLSKPLDTAAQMHSDDQANNAVKRKAGNVGSNGFLLLDRFSKAGYQMKTVSEFTAWNCGDEAACMEKWMNSPVKKMSILDPKFVDFGSAVARDKDNTPYYTVIFGIPNSKGADNEEQPAEPKPSPDSENRAPGQ